MIINYEALKTATDKYSLTLKAHQNNPKDFNAVEAWDEATEEFDRLINNDEMGIISTLLAELEETRSTLKSVTECWNDEYQRNKGFEQRVAAAEKILKVEKEQSAYYEKQMWHFHALAEVEAINNAELERAKAAQADHINQQQDRIDTLENRNGELGKHVGNLEKLLKGTEESLIASVDRERELEQRLQQPIRQQHAEWSNATFGNVGPIGPLEHLAEEALEAAAQPSDLLEWADMQFLLWDAQRRAGITDQQMVEAMERKLPILKARNWPTPKDGEPCFHVKVERDAE